MISSAPRVMFRALAPVLLLAGASLSLQAQAKGHTQAPTQAPGGHGTPPGWRFTWPQGDPIRGRQVFLKLECYACHAVQGETFSAPSEAGKIGPELAAMGPLHAREYFAEAIVNPSAVVEPGKGYGAPDGSSRMPSYNDAITVQELIDLVAYLTGLRPQAGAPVPAGQGGPDGHKTH